MIGGFEIRGDSINPYHLSVGTVVFDNNKIALVKKFNGIYTLPRETMYSGESLEESLARGVKEELGITVEIEKFLGSQITCFDRPDGTNVEKTTIYFLASKTGDSEKEQADDETADEIEWFEPKNAKKLLEEQGNDESRLIERVI